MQSRLAELDEEIRYDTMVEKATTDADDEDEFFSGFMTVVDDRRHHIHFPEHEKLVFSWTDLCYGTHCSRQSEGASWGQGLNSAKHPHQRYWLRWPISGGWFLSWTMRFSSGSMRPQM